MYANTKKEMQHYFEKILKGEKAIAPHRKLSENDLETWRRKTWSTWEFANQRNNQLPLTIDNASNIRSGKWILPDTLEPNAIMPFYCFSKGKQPKEGYPVFLYLHGSGPKNEEWQNGLHFAKTFADSPSIYFVPQIPNEGKWYRWYQRSKQYAWENLLRQIFMRNDVNPNRIYFYGISEGGYGSQRLASFYADYLAGAGPMAGGEPLKNAPTENLMNIAFSLRTGNNDTDFYRNILTGYTQKSLDSLRHIYPTAYNYWVDLIPQKGHYIDYTPTTPWLSTFSRNPWPRHFIWEDFEMDSVHRKGFYNLLVNKRPDSQLRTRYEMTITDNIINIQVKNIHYTTIETDSIYGIEMKFTRKYTTATSGSFTLFLDEHLVNLSQPVQVIVNERTIFSGKLDLDESNFLRSIAAFFDPLRIYPAAIDINI